MALADFYPVIKASHVGLAMLSGGLFAGRGLGVLLGAQMPRSLAMRRLSQVIDTALLTAALLLLAALQLNPFATPWLLVKLALLIAYIVLGVLALRRAPTQAGKALAFAAALTCFVMMIAVARTHDPLGFLRVVGW
ncbi:SirB2 family protein [Hydrogenophaga sp.]|uniref:SirB2 family protein n=1 Tax=Hydrogenophaga sp. TaxID=1904254 RepID=UPI00260C51D6|nr:SirB2 family protein [Hydrogenophaga sp.]MCW5654533.1 SirB2 family protein [Hydrogenophaga sp.]